MTGDELRTLRAVDRGRQPSPRDPTLHVLLAKGYVDSGRDGHHVTDLGRRALRGDLRRPGALPAWLHLTILVAVTIGLWLVAGRGWEGLLSGFALAGCGVPLVDAAARRLRGRRRATES